MVPVAVVLLNHARDGGDRKTWPHCERARPRLANRTERNARRVYRKYMIHSYVRLKSVADYRFDRITHAQSRSTAPVYAVLHTFT